MTGAYTTWWRVILLSVSYRLKLTRDIIFVSQALLILLAGNTQLVDAEAVEPIRARGLSTTRLSSRRPVSEGHPTSILRVRSAGNTLADGTGDGRYLDAVAHVKLCAHQPCSCSVVRSLAIV
jgi:hypothetical protein